MLSCWCILGFGERGLVHCREVWHEVEDTARSSHPSCVLTSSAPSRQPVVLGGLGFWSATARSRSLDFSETIVQVASGAPAGLRHGILAAVVGFAAAAARRQRGLRRRQRSRVAAWAVAIGSKVPDVKPGLAAGKQPVVLRVQGVVAETTDEDKKQILNGLDLVVHEGEVHAVMGPNGSGKSTLAKVLIGDPAYRVIAGTATIGDKSLFEMEAHERALEGLFLAFQSPPSINGVSNLDFLRAAYNSQRRKKKEGECDVIEFYGLVSEKLRQLKIDPDFLNRNVNEGFSGGERKRNEMLQMSVLEPRIAILDEIDSGLDIDALKDVADTISRLRDMDSKRAVLMVTHFERFLTHVDPDFVHIMYRGRIIKSGGPDLANKIDELGYDWVIAEEAAKQQLLEPK